MTFWSGDSGLYDTSSNFMWIMNKVLYPFNRKSVVVYLVHRRYVSTWCIWEVY